MRFAWRTNIDTECGTVGMLVPSKYYRPCAYARDYVMGRQPGTEGLLLLVSSLVCNCHDLWLLLNLARLTITFVSCVTTAGAAVALPYHM